MTFDPAEAVAAITPIGLAVQAAHFPRLNGVLVFPFSRLVHIWSAPMTYPTRPYQVVQQRLIRSDDDESAGISGWSGCGKTTLIVALLPRLRARG